MNIAKLFIGDPKVQKGYFNNVIARTSQLIKVEKDVDCYMIRHYNSWLARIFKKEFLKNKREDFVVVNEIAFKNVWVKLTLIDYLMVVKLKKRPFIGRKQIESYVGLFKDYDLVSCHGVSAIYLANKIKEKYNIPYVSTWHGSDINVLPFSNKSAKKYIQILLKSANHNFFVSEKLLQVSNEICYTDNKSVFYTGPADSFKELSDIEKNELRLKHNISSKYVVGFVGNYVAIKNVLVLPDIFLRLKEEFQNEVMFLTVGNGELEHELITIIKKKGIVNYRNLGKRAPGEMCEIINLFDVLILPSLNEGMPRVALEAQACGVYIVGSDRGGIPEAVGKQNNFALDDNFVDNITKRIVDLLQNDNPKPKLPEKFSWEGAIKKELEAYNNCFKS